MKSSIWTKALLVLTVFTVFFVTVADEADARRGRFVAPKKSFTETPKKAQDNAGQVSRSDSGTTTGTKAGANTTGAAGTAGTQRGFFGGGSFLKGLMIGGLAGLLFGSLFAGMGFLGELLGLMINVLAIYFLFVLVRNVYRYFRDRKPPRESRRPY
jgi:predicted lipid-binding transport protein (Tim44 family)